MATRAGERSSGRDAVAESGLSAGSDDDALVGSVQQFLRRARERQAPLVLVVDRDAAWLGPLADQLAGLNCRLVIAPQRAAVDLLIERLRPTLVLWAVAPEPDLTLAWLERVLAVLPRAQVALLLDRDQAAPDLIADAQALGVVGVLYRPLQADALLQAVRSWTRLR